MAWHLTIGWDPIPSDQVREGGAKCVAHVDVRAIFGAPDVEAARHTAVIQLFEGRLHSAISTLGGMDCPVCRFNFFIFLL